jgi:hypothetical protein
MKGTVELREVLSDYNCECTNSLVFLSAHNCLFNRQARRNISLGTIHLEVDLSYSHCLVWYYLEG